MSLKFSCIFQDPKHFHPNPFNMRSIFNITYPWQLDTNPHSNFHVSIVRVFLVMDEH